MIKLLNDIYIVQKIRWPIDSCVGVWAPLAAARSLINSAEEWWRTSSCKVHLDRRPIGRLRDVPWGKSKVRKLLGGSFDAG